MHQTEMMRWPTLVHPVLLAQKLEQVSGVTSAPGRNQLSLRKKDRAALRPGSTVGHFLPAPHISAFTQRRKHRFSDTLKIRRTHV